MVKKKRCTYPKELRAEAKAKHGHLVTINIEFANGDRLEEQKVMNMEEGRFVRWVAALLFCDELQQIPDIEEKIKEWIS